MRDDRRLIEDYLPIEAISVEASGEPRTKGHLSTLHLWRARRPLVACRAAIFGALVSASRFVPDDASDVKKKSLGRANAAKFVERLCKYPGEPRILREAQRYLLEAQAERLSQESGISITVEEIQAGRSPRPKVLDMFAGGGTIPLEAARLGCESHAIEMNPVAYLIELCTVTFPQQFGPGLADDVEAWAKHVLAETRRTVRDVLPVLTYQKGRVQQQSSLVLDDEDEPKSLSVIANYWTRTVPCPNPQCKATVPLYRQTWLRKKDSGFVALRPDLDLKAKHVRYKVVHAKSEAGLGFDPAEGSEGSSTVCPFCRTTLPGSYVRITSARKMLTNSFQ